MIFKKKKLPEVPKKQEPDRIDAFQMYSFWMTKIKPGVVFGTKDIQKGILWKESKPDSINHLQFDSNLNTIYIIDNNIVWEASPRHDGTVDSFRPSCIKEASDAREKIQTWWNGSFIVLDLPKSFRTESFSRKYAYAIDFIINHTTKSVSFKIKYVNITLRHTLFEKLESEVKLSEENFRLKLFSNSKTNIRNMLHKYSGHNYLPELVWERLNDILKGFIIEEFGKDVCPDFKVVDLYSAFAMAYFPTEPRLFYLLKEFGCSDLFTGTFPHVRTPRVSSEILDRLNISLEDDRSDLNIFYRYFKDVPKSIKKLYLKDPNILALYNLFKVDFEIDDINLIRYWLKFFIGVANPCHKQVQINKDYTAEILVKNTFDPEQGYLFVGTFFPVRALEAYKILRKEFNCSPEKAFNILFKAIKTDRITSHDYWDVVNMFKDNWERFDKNSPVIRSFLRYGVCTETHDLLSNEILQLGKPNRIFNNITDKQKKRYEYDFKVKDTKYCFRLAEDSNRLKEIGEALRICVGSADYDLSVLKGQCLIAFIVLVEGESQKYVGCIEIRKEKIVHQARTFCNHSFSGDLEAVFNQWLKKANLQFHGNFF